MLARRFRWAWAASLLFGVPPGADGARLDPDAMPMLQVVQWVQTDAAGRVIDGAVTLALRAPGSTGEGLRLGPSRDLPPSAGVPAPALPVLAWRDPVRSGRFAAAPGGDATPLGLPDSGHARSALLDQAARHCAAHAPALAAALVTQLHSLGVAEAWFNFRQQLVLAGRARSLSWDLHVDRSGGWFATTPALELPAERTLRVRYTTRAAAEGLPPGVRFADGGWLRWQVEDGFGHPLGAPAGRDTGGAFDGAEGLRCLLGEARSGCAAQQADLPTLQDQLGARRVELTVASALRPHFLVDPAARRYALAALHIERWVESADGRCTAPPWRYVNAYQAAFVLDARIEAYSRGLGQAWQRRTVVSGSVRTPMQDWTIRTLPLAAGSLASLDASVIDPQGAGLVPLDAFPAGIQQVEASPIRCRAGGTP